MAICDASNTSVSCVVFHNLKDYDEHHLMHCGLANKLDWEFSLIYQTGDKLLAVIVRIPVSQFDEVGEEEQEEEAHDADFDSDEETI